MHFFPLCIIQILAKVLSSSKTAYSVYLFELLTAPYEERVAAKKGLSGYYSIAYKESQPVRQPASRQKRREAS